MKLKSIQEFTSLYSLSKTLRFELKPIGNTLDNIDKKADTKLSKDYQKMKDSIDKFHKYFIDHALEGLKLDQEKLIRFRDLYGSSQKEKEAKVEFEKLQTELRENLVKGFKSNKKIQVGKHTCSVKDVYGKLFNKGMIEFCLKNWIEGWKDTQGEKPFFDKKFETFNTYFVGFYDNRKNIYTDEPLSTAIAYRLIHENLPRFVDNMRVFEQLKNIPQMVECVAKLSEDIKDDLGFAIDEMFELEGFSKVLSQRGIDLYNLIVGGKTTEKKQKIRGLNEYVNEYNQKQSDKNKKLPKFRILYKQILSDRESQSFIIEQFKKATAVTEAINSYYRYGLLCYQPKDKEGTENILEGLPQLLKSINDYNLNQIYVSKKGLQDMSQRLFGRYRLLEDAIEAYLRAKTQKTKKEQFLGQDYFAISCIQEAVDFYIGTLEKDDLLYSKYTPDCIANYFHTHYKAAKREGSTKEFSISANIRAKYSAIKGLLDNNQEEDLFQNENDVENIKLFLDALMELLYFVKPLMLPADSMQEKDPLFYGQLEPWYTQLDLLIPLYNKVRNFATKKPYSTQKIKLNFENSTLLAGWDVNKEEANAAVLLLKEGNYFLGIMDKSHKKIFEQTPKATSDSTYAKVNYKLLRAPQDLYHVFFAKKWKAYPPSEEIVWIRNHSSHTKRGKPRKGYEKKEFNLEDCHKMINFLKAAIEKHSEWPHCFRFKFSDTSTYESMEAFYKEVNEQTYAVSFTNIDESYINTLVDERKLYLFQIYNKDFSGWSKGAPNLHTLYWKALFSETNLKDVVYRLNGSAEIFYRERSIPIERAVVHKANEPIDNKNPLNTKKKSTFTYDLIKDRRYTVDKFQFHVPITLNFKQSATRSINADVLEYLKNNRTVNIIGLDRGERHLIYYTIINSEGKILEQGSFNRIKDDNYPIETDYQDLLSRKEKERAEARKSWKTIENIKELKEGYLSQVVHKLARKMVDNNAILVMEDLNIGFKRGRFAVERQVYQKLEKALIEKLNYIVFKDKDENQPGGLYKAFQLTNKFESFSKMGKQSGFVFYQPAGYTSKIDPTTGFVNLFYVRYENIENAKAFFGKFERIAYNSTENYFEFKFDYDKFTTKFAGTKREWTLCTYGTRIRTFRNPDKNHAWDTEEVDVTHQLKTLFKDYGISWENGDLVGAIVEQNESSFFKRLIDIIRLVLQMRNSIANSDVDYIISPVKNSKGQFFDSRVADGSLPKDADANGAYHVARKGLKMLRQLSDIAEVKKAKLAVSNEDWLKFVQEESNK